MNRFFVSLLFVAMTAATAARSAPSEVMAQIHFGGAARIAADTNAMAFTNLWCIPEAQALRNQTLDKLSHAPYDRLKAGMPSVTNDAAVWFRPLLDDALGEEWFLQIRDATNGSPEYVLAIHLPAGRAQLWRTNLENVLKAWTGLPVENTPNGWNFKKHLPPDRVRFVRAGDWVVLGCGQDELPLTEEMVRRITAGQRPGPLETNAWLSVDLDWPRLARLLPAMPPLGLPETQAQVIGRGGNLHLDGKLIFPQPLRLALEPWRMPTNAMYMPLDGFAAVRGIRPWLEKQKWLQAYAFSPLPDQLFIWAMSQMPLQTFAAAPVPDALKALAEVNQKFSADTNWQRWSMLPLTLEATNDQISWVGLPLMVPNLQALHEPAGEFLFAGVFPNTPSSQPLPPELFAQLARSNLVYYHWEITGERLKQLPQITQMALMISRCRQLEAESAAGRWLAQAGPALGNTVTEVVQTGPNELTFQRRAPAGFTAVELIALANWLETTNFPGCNLDLPPPRPRHRPHPQTSNAPPAKIPVPPPAALRTAP